MAKQSKNLGVRKACENCHKTLIKAADIKDSGADKILIKDTCRHCKVPMTIEIGKKTYIEVYKTILALLLAATSIISLWKVTGLNTKFALLIDTYGFNIRK